MSTNVSTGKHKHEPEPKFTPTHTHIHRHKPPCLHKETHARPWFHSQRDGHQDEVARAMRMSQSISPTVAPKTIAAPIKKKKKRTQHGKRKIPPRAKFPDVTKTAQQNAVAHTRISNIRILKLLGFRRVIRASFFPSVRECRSVPEIVLADDIHPRIGPSRFDISFLQDASSHPHAHPFSPLP